VHPDLLTANFLLGLALVGLVRSCSNLVKLRAIDLSLVVNLGIPNLVKLHAGGLPVSFLSHRIKSLEDSLFKSFSRDDFPNAPTRCLVKYL
jgi:hypothetical protein